MNDPTDIKGCPVVLPSRITRLPRDRRNYPVPYVTMIDPVTGQPDYRVLDLQRQIQCITSKLCGICGDKLGKFKAFIGGPKSGQTRIFSDPAMHRDCAEYASQVCPFITKQTAEYRDITPEQEAAFKEHGVTIGVFQTGDHEARVTSDMFLYIANEYRILLVSKYELVMQVSEFLETIKIEQARMAWHSL